MRIAVEDIREGVSTLEFACGSESIGLEAEGVCFTDPVTARLELFKQRDKVYVKAELSVAIELECARCLSPVNRTLEGTLEIQYRPLPMKGVRSFRNPGGSRGQSSLEMAQYPLDDIGIGYYPDEYIDMSGDFRESLLLELPTKVVCSEDCKGLCPQCGQDLNEEKCNCCSEPEEVRASKLADLIEMLQVTGDMKPET